MAPDPHLPDAQPADAPARWLVALDLEATLVSNAVSQFPRPGLAAFFAGLAALPVDLVYFTGVEESRLRAVLATLAAEGTIPAWAATLPAVAWDGRYKDLTFTGRSPARVLLVDDMATALPPAQAAQWIRVPPFDPPFPADDAALADALATIRARVTTAAPAEDAGRGGTAPGRARRVRA